MNEWQLGVRLFVKGGMKGSYGWKLVKVGTSYDCKLEKYMGICCMLGKGMGKIKSWKSRYVGRAKFLTVLEGGPALKNLNWDLRFTSFFFLFFFFFFFFYKLQSIEIEQGNIPTGAIGDRSKGYGGGGAVCLGCGHMWGFLWMRFHDHCKGFIGSRWSTSGYKEYNWGDSSQTPRLPTVLDYTYQEPRQSSGTPIGSSC